MNSIEEDFKDIELMVLEFLNQASIKEKLFFLFHYKRDDWEKWFQIEFAFFIQKTFEVNVKRELPAFTDSPLKQDSRFFIDIAYKLVDERDYVFLEIKCNRRSSALRRGLMRDISKLSHIRKIKDRPNRSSWCIGFHRSCSEYDIESMKNFLKIYEFAKHEVIKLCQCDNNVSCECLSNSLGVSIIYCSA